jgi:Ribosomal protein S7
MRKAKAKKRPLIPDPRFNDELVTRFVNMMMLDGKKSVSYRIFYEAVDVVSEKTGEGNGLELWKEALNNVMPHVEVRSKRVGGSNLPDSYPDSPRSQDIGGDEVAYQLRAEAQRKVHGAAPGGRNPRAS